MNLVKSKRRVADHGEVFTPAWMVEAMLDLVKDETERIDSRFLEPACGSGNFLVAVLRYVERNPLRAGLAPTVNGWQWSSLAPRTLGDRPAWYDEGPVKRGRDWPSYVAQPQTDVDLVALRRSAERGAPYGSDRWQERMTGLLGLESTLRSRGRPRKRPDN
jgi:hypothetical protein